MAVWLQNKVRKHWLEVRHKLNTGPVCDAQCRWCSACGLQHYTSEHYLLHTAKYSCWTNSIF